jgi:hypothetical protein
MKHFAKDPCLICGQPISNAGFAYTRHEDAHARRGETSINTSYATDQKEYEAYWYGRREQGDYEPMSYREWKAFKEVRLTDTGTRFL